MSDRIAISMIPSCTSTHHKCKHFVVPAAACNDAWGKRSGYPWCLLKLLKAVANAPQSRPIQAQHAVHSLVRASAVTPRSRLSGTFAEGRIPDWDADQTPASRAGC